MTRLVISRTCRILRRASMSLGTKLFTWRFGALVGEDQFGNRYYRDRRSAGARFGKRWVMYKGSPEASKVPPEWHGWLHFITDDAPTGTPAPVPSWRKEHLPNLTGTEAAYRPPGHTLSSGNRAASSADYEPWRPS